MAVPRRIRLPKQWPEYIKSGILHAISLASVVLSFARTRDESRAGLRVQRERATAELALLREEPSIKDIRWQWGDLDDALTQRMRILQVRAARGWRAEKTARVFLVDLQTLLVWMRRLDEPEERTLIQTVELANRYPDFVRNFVRQLKCLFPTMGHVRMAQVLGRAGLVLGATTIRCMVRETGGPPEEDADVTSRRRRSGFASTRWCERRDIRPRYGRIGEPASIAIVE